MLDKIGGGVGVSSANNMQQLSSKAGGESSDMFDFKSQKSEEKAPALDKLEEVLPALIEVLQQLVEMIEDMQDGGSPSEEESGNKGGAMVKPESGAGGGPASGGGEGGNNIKDSRPDQTGKIPEPTEHIQTFDLGGKEVKIGGDGTASKAEVQATADSMKDLYQNSETFKGMIDDSSDKGFEVSVGKRSDNMSWGNADGRLFMNIGNISPGNSDDFQSILAHEVAHASIDLSHGAQMERIEDSVATEA